MRWHGEHMRVRICLDISYAQLRGKKICLGSSHPIWVKFTYERLPNFYYLCRKIGRGHPDSDHWKIELEQFFVNKYSYGPWLRASGYAGSVRAHKE